MSAVILVSRGASRHRPIPLSQRR